MENNHAGFRTSIKPGSEMSHAKTFPLFSNLPAEIRLMIWKEFHDAYAPRAVTLCYNPDRGFYSKTPLHSSFYVNHESRVEAPKFLNSAFHNHVTRIGDLAPVHPPNHTPIYVNFSKDVIYLQAAEGDDIRSTIWAMSSVDHNMLQHLAINDPTKLQRFRNADLGDLLRSLVVMPQLQRLSVVQINAWLVWDKHAEAEAQHVFFKGHGIRGRVWQKNTTRETFVEEMRELENTHGWKAPDVCVISPYELMVMPANWQRCNGTLTSRSGRWSIINPTVRG
jgi:hypothetical protein